MDFFREYQWKCDQRSVTGFRQQRWMRQICGRRSGSWKARGFGGVEVVVLASVPEEIARGEDGWGHEHWNQTVAVIADETENSRCQWIWRSDPDGRSYRR